MIYFDEDSYYGVTGYGKAINEASEDDSDIRQNTGNNIGIEYFENNLDKISIGKALSGGFLGILKLFEGKMKRRFQKCARLLRDMQKAFVSNDKGIIACSTDSTSAIGKLFRNFKASIFSRKSEIGLIPFVNEYTKEIHEDFKQAYNVYEGLKKSKDASEVQKGFGTILTMFTEKYLSIGQLIGRESVKSIKDLTKDDLPEIEKQKETYNGDIKAQSPKFYGRIRSMFENNVLKRYINIGNSMINNCVTKIKTDAEDKNAANIVKISEELKASWMKQEDFFKNNFIYVMVSILDSKEFATYSKFIMDECFKGYLDPESFINTEEHSELENPDDFEDDENDENGDNDENRDNGDDRENREGGENNASGDNHDRWTSAFVYDGEDVDVYSLTTIPEALHRSPDNSKESDVLNEEGENDEESEGFVFVGVRDKKKNKIISANKISVKNVTDKEYADIMKDGDFEERKLSSDEAKAISASVESTTPSITVSSAKELKDEIEKAKTSAENGEATDNNNGGDEDKDDKNDDKDNKDNDGGEANGDDNKDDQNQGDEETTGDEQSDAQAVEIGNDIADNVAGEDKPKTTLSPEDEQWVDEFISDRFKPLDMEDKDKEEEANIVKRSFLTAIAKRIVAAFRKKNPDEKLEDSEIEPIVDNVPNVDGDVAAIVNSEKDDEEYRTRLEKIKANVGVWLDKQIETMEKREAEQQKDETPGKSADEMASEIFKFAESIMNEGEEAIADKLKWVEFSGGFNSKIGTFVFAYAPDKKSESYKVALENGRFNDASANGGNQDASANNDNTVMGDENGSGDAGEDNEQMNEGKLTKGLFAAVKNLCAAIKSKTNDLAVKWARSEINTAGTSNLNNPKLPSKPGEPNKTGLYRFDTGRIVTFKGKNTDMFLTTAFYINDAYNNDKYKKGFYMLVSLSSYLASIDKKYAEPPYDNFTVLDVAPEQNALKEAIETLMTNFDGIILGDKDNENNVNNGNGSDGAGNESFRISFSKESIVSESNTNVLVYSKHIGTDLKDAKKYYILSERMFEDGRNTNINASINADMREMFRHNHTLSEMAEAVRSNKNMSLIPFATDTTYRAYGVAANAMTEANALCESTVLVRFSNDDEHKIVRVINCGIAKSTK